MRSGDSRREFRGSALLLVVALLAIVGMLGSVLLLTARLDRQRASVSAEIAQADQTIDGILTALVADRLADLHISSEGIPYGALDANPALAERQCMDYPDEACDAALACIEPVDKAGVRTWRHISNPPGSGLSNTTDVPVTDAGLVDTDGDGVGDARLFPLGAQAGDGGEYFAAVRMIDAGGLLNANVADRTRPAAAGRVMDAGDVAVAALGEGTDPEAIRAARAMCPFDMGDMLAVSWRGPGPTAVGRLLTCVPAGGTGAGRWTIASASRLDVPRRGAVPPAVRVDVNAAAAAGDFQSLYQAFHALLSDSRSAQDADAEAAQLAVNVIDYVDADDEITAARVPGAAGDWFVYGLERQPFITEVFHYEQADPCAGTSRQLSAIELFNPYDSTIRLAGYALICGGNAYNLSGTIAPGGRLVVRSDDWGDVGPSLEVDPSFDTVQAVVLVRVAGNGTAIALDEAEGLFVMLPSDQPGENWRVRQRDDDPARARYAARAEHNYLGNQVPSTRYVGSDGRVTERNNLGAPNYLDPIFGPVLAAIETPSPRPVYVRNGPLLNVGELATRIYRAGPTAPEPQPICDTLRWDEESLWLSLGGTTGTIAPGARPRVPPGCAAAEYLAVRPAGAEPGPIQGLVNVNTAPPALLSCLGGLGNLGLQQRESIVGEIVAYRDKTLAPSGRDYAAVARGDPTATGLVGLRNEPGFATAGEIAIPLALAGGGHHEYGPAAPACYAVSSGGSDDGLGEASGGYPQDDYAKRHILYCWLSNQVTVRSDTFIAYIRVQRGTSPAAPAQHYVATIDRSRCPQESPQPSVVLFAQVR